MNKEQFKQILELNRTPVLSDWFIKKLEALVADGLYTDTSDQLRDGIVNHLVEYREKHKKDCVVIGMSGGLDSSLTAALFSEAGYYVHGVLIPIHQDPTETQRGLAACEALGINHTVLDLTEQFDYQIHSHALKYDEFLVKGIRRADAVRRGNIRARMRMITLYNIASIYGGFVASTDNYSELAAGFWTLHGDVGDVSPIQSLTKSWEVPLLATKLGVPESIVKATPTDGLGIANGDEDQFGFSYLEFDIGLLTMLREGVGVIETATGRDREIMDEIAKRIGNSAFKRVNPYNLAHPLHSRRYDQLADLDLTLSNLQE